MHIKKNEETKERGKNIKSEIILVIFCQKLYIGKHFRIYEVLKFKYIFYSIRKINT